MPEKETIDVPNGPGAAALLATGLGSAVLGILTLAREASATLAAFFDFYPPSGPLSGVTTCAVAVWLIAWFGLGRLWRQRDVPMTIVAFAAGALLLVGFALTFPPTWPLLLGGKS